MHATTPTMMMAASPPLSLARLRSLSRRAAGGRAGRNATRAQASGPQRSAQAGAAAAAGLLLVTGPAGPASAARPALEESASALQESLDAVTAGLKEALESSADTASAFSRGLNSAEGYAAKVLSKLSAETAPVVKPALKATAAAVAPVVRSAAERLDVDIDSVASAASAGAGLAGTAVTTAGRAVGAAAGELAPLLRDAADAVDTLDPFWILESSATVLLVALLWPVLGPPIGRYFRGYAGDVTPFAAYDGIAIAGGYLIDLRPPGEAERQGSPAVGPAADRVVATPRVAVEDASLRSRLADAESVEAASTAAVVDATRTVRGGAALYLLGNDAGFTRAVARELARLGHSRVYVISGGMSGWGGWADSKLGVEPTPFRGVVTPSAVLLPAYARPKEIKEAKVAVVDETPTGGIAAVFGGWTGGTQRLAAPPPPAKRLQNKPEGTQKVSRGTGTKVVKR